MNLFINHANKSGDMSLPGLQLAVLFLPVILLRFIFIGDTAFVNDEAVLIGAAFKSNMLGVWAERGLLGSRGLVYGPLPIWIYQCFLKLSIDPINLVYMKALLDTTLLCFGLIALSNTQYAAKFPKIIWLIPVSSPFFWFYSRSLWDNTLVIGFVLISFSYYVRYIEKSKLLNWVMAAWFAAAALFVHFMAVTWVVALIIHSIINFCRKKFSVPEILKLLLGLGPGALVFMYYLCQESLVNRGAQVFQVSVTGVEGAIFGIRSLTALAFDYITGPWLGAEAPFSVQLITGLCFISALPIIGLSIHSIYKALLAHKITELHNISALVWFVIIFHGLLSLFGDLHTHPQYFNAVWIFSLCALGSDLSVSQIKWHKYALQLCVVGNVVVTVQTLIFVHNYHGIRFFRYGSTLENKWQVAQEIAKTGSQLMPSISTDVVAFPRSIIELVELAKASSQTTQVQQTQSAQVTWSSPQSNIDAQISLQFIPQDHKPSLINFDKK